MIEKLKREYIKDIAEIERECFAAPWTEIALEEEIDNPNAMFFCFVEKTAVLGYLGMHKVIDEGHITNIGVRYGCRRRGIASALIRHMLDEAQSVGINALTLEVRVSNIPAQRLYESFGFEAAGLRRSFYSDGEDAIIMWKHDI